MTFSLKNKRFPDFEECKQSSENTHKGWWGAPKYISEDDFLKCCYAIYSGNEQEIPDINKDFLEDIEFFINCHF